MTRPKNTKIGMSAKERELCRTKWEVFKDKLPDRILIALVILTFMTWFAWVIKTIAAHY